MLPGDHRLRLTFGCWLLVAVLLAPCLSGQTSAAPREVDYPRDGVQLGTGWDVNRDLKKGARCVTGATRTDTAQQVKGTITSVTDRYSVTNKLQVSVAAQMKAIAGSGSFKTDFAKQLQLDQEYQSFLGYAKVINGPSYLAPDESQKVDLTTHYAEMASKNAPQFEKECGQAFVSTIYTSADVYGMFTFETKSVDEQERLRVAIEGSAFSTSMSASVAKEVTNYTANSQMKLVTVKSGGSADPVPTTLAELTQSIRDTAKSAKEAGQATSIEIIRYDSLPSWPAARADWQDSPYGQIVTQYGKFSALYEIVTNILNHQDSYIMDRPIRASLIEALSDRLSRHLKSLKNALTKCEGSAGRNCSISPEDKIDDYAYRRLLPAVSGSFPEDTIRTAAYAEQKQAAEALAAKKAWSRKRCIEAVLCHAYHLDDQTEARDTVDEQARFDHSRVSVLSAEAAYDKALQKAVAATWIAKASDSRCWIDPTASDCLSRKALSDWSGQVPVCDISDKFTLYACTKEASDIIESLSADQSKEDRQ